MIVGRDNVTIRRCISIVMEEFEGYEHGDDQDADREANKGSGGERLAL